ncbi:MAG: LLM class flavin-dependent oxidoreductase [Alphaproteobacteria bacterium]|nr:LLM class flavin-dependent oxidoreductase [Alphaproteobacteria bacterium]
MTERKLHLGGFFSVPGNHLAGWRHPDAVPTYDMDFQGYAHITQVAEAAKFDTIFFQDTVGVSGSRALARGERTRAKLSRTVKLEPTATLAALAVVTERIGLVATATTTYNEPYNIARRFMSIDHISGGRAGWNLVTSQIEDESENFGFDQHMPHADRYERAAEFYEVVTGLWDSWEEDGLLRDKQSGLYMDRDKVHFLDHVGRHFRVKGPLNITRSPQGRPVVAQAGSSEAGRELAARTADVVFTAQTRLEEAKAFYADIKGRMTRHGRTPDDVKIMPGLTPVLGRTMEEAQEKYEELQALMPDDVALQSLSHISGGLDLSKYPLDGPLPELPPSNAAKARQALVVKTARERNMTLRQIARQTAAGTGHRVLVGTPHYMADEMEAWLKEEAVDGFNIVCNHYPKPFEDFCRLVVPELQRRGLFRSEYEGQTLRDHLGLKVPENRYTRAARLAREAT